MRGSGDAAKVEEADALLARMGMLVGAIHQGLLGEVRHLIHIGIGGSALGPKLAIDALAREGAQVDVHVVSNIDGCALEAAFAACDPQTTMIAVASKTFTTIETMTNAQSALTWLTDNGVADPYGRVVALTASPDKAVEWGVDETRVLPFPESVGGRYSLWAPTPCHRWAPQPMPKCWTARESRAASTIFSATGSCYSASSTPVAAM